MAKKYEKVIEETNETPVVEEVKEIPKTLTGKVINCVGLNIRVKPNTDADISFVALPGDEFIVKNNLDDPNWISVKSEATNNKWLYAMSAYVSIN